MTFRGDLLSTSLADVQVESDASTHEDKDTTPEEPLLAHMTKK